jgi:hypothetical protein
LPSMQRSKVDMGWGLFSGRPAADSGAVLVAAAPVAIESAFQHERAEVRFWLQ